MNQFICCPNFSKHRIAGEVARRPPDYRRIGMPAAYKYCLREGKAVSLK